MNQQFVRAGILDEENKKRKRYLEGKLQKVKDEFEASKRKRELKEDREDADWMLPSVSSKIDKKSKKKKKKHKKRKKEKKKNESSSQSEDSENEWEEVKPKHRDDKQTDGKNVDKLPDLYIQESETVEKPTSNNKVQVERDEWMSSLFDIAASSTTSREHKTKQRKNEERRLEEESRKKVHESRELNPYWKDSGKGLPEKPSEPQVKVSFGDGGQSWIEKAYQRAVQQAAHEGVPLEEIVNKRWGSMEKLNALRKLAQPKNVTSESSSGWRRHHPSSSTAPRKPNQQQSADEIKKKSLMETALDEESNEIVEKSDENSSSESSDDVEPEEEIVTRPLSEKEKNEISAKILRAELMGNEEMCEKLKAELATGRVSEKRVKQQSNNIGDERGDEEEQIILRKDRHGNVFPLQQSSGRYDDLSSRKSKKKVIKTHDEKGERTMYFENDSNTSLQAMVEEERMTSSADHMSMMAKLSGKITASQDDYALDDEFVQVVATKGLSSKEEARKREKAISAQKQREQQLTSCKYCFGNPNLSKHLIIAIGKQVYLALPMTSSLTVGHCLIIPRNHLMGQTYFDEDVIEEVKNFKKTLVKMFKENDEDVIFMETCKYLHHENHTTIECVPVPQDVGDTAPIYFKKALQECDTEWSQNKKIVDIKSTVARAIPKGLPYFSVEFGTSGGYGHVIEDEASFPFYFGKEIIGGVLDVEPRLWRKPPKESFEKHKKKVLKFAEQWKKFDFT